MQTIALRVFAAIATFIIGTALASVAHIPRFVRSSSDALIKQEVLDVDSKYLRAHEQRDTAALDRILADDFTITRDDGYSTNKAERLSLVEDPDFTYLSIDTYQVKVHVNDDTEAVVTGKARITGRYMDREFTSPPYRFIRTYEKQQGQWRIASVRVSSLGRR
jgi:ketosteroid isomerase-like protein